MTPALSLPNRKPILGIQDKATKFIQEQEAELKALDVQKKGMSDREVQRELARQKLVSDWLARAVKCQMRGCKKINKLNQVYAMQDELASDSVVGMKNAMANWLESATEMGSQFGEVMTAALDGISNQFVDLLSTGKASFKDFANSIIKMILQIITKLSIAYALQAAMGWMGAGSGGGFAGGFSMGFAGGGYTGDGARNTKQLDNLWSKGKLSDSEFLSPVWMVAIQQGGQIKDSFGGIGNSLRALTSLITPARLAMAGLAGVFGVVVKASWDMYSSQRDVEKALILTGNVADINGKSSKKCLSVSKRVAESTGDSISRTKDAMTAAIKAGAESQKEIETITKGISAYSKITGDGLDEVADKFTKLATDPLNAMREMNKEMNIFTVDQVKQIGELIRAGKDYEAGLLAQQFAAEGAAQKQKELYDTAAPLQKCGWIWMDIKDWASKAWSTVSAYTWGVLNGTIEVVQSVIRIIKSTLAQADKAIVDFIVNVGEKINKYIPDAVGKFDLSGLKGLSSELDSQIIATSEDYKTLTRDVSYFVEKYKQDYASKIKVQKYSQREIEKEIKKQEELNRKTKQQKTPKGAKYRVDAGTKAYEQHQRDILALQVELKVLQEHQNVNDKISAQRRQLFVIEAQHAVLLEASKRRQLTEEEKSLVANYEKRMSLPNRKPILGIQDKATKFIQEQEAELKALDVQKKGMSDREVQRELARQKLVSDWLARAVKCQMRGCKKINKLNQVYAMQDELASDSVVGMKNAMANWLESATEMGSQFGEVMTAALDGISNQFVDLLSTGKASFKDFANSIIKMILQIITKLSIAYALQAAMGWMGAGSGGGFAGGFSMGFAGGGYTGDGAKYEPAGVVHKGEFVMTKEATKRIGVDNLYRMMRGYANGGYVGGGSQSGGGMVISGSAPSFNIGNIDVNVNNGSDPKGLTNGVKAIVSEELNKCFSQGGRGYEFVLERTNSNISPSNGAFYWRFYD
ncbi:tail length tape measure protein [Citrobacter phage HCF1]|uniref:Tail length tape-measure protein n=1 Tax=Citrobacter phage HCF1 TaxID=2849700 RepID=A0ABX6D3M4_9CAUD|nr:tail length tape measure protein [Citrobacter phage HCF1]